MAANRLLGRKYPAKEHARRVAAYLKTNGRIYIEGAKLQHVEDGDGEAPFRQRRAFFYLTGCEAPDSAVLYEASKDRLTLFIPPIDPDSVIWSGLPLLPDEAKQRFDVDEVLTTDQVKQQLSQSSSGDFQLEASYYDNAISGNAVNGTKIDREALKDAIDECRAVKDEYEIDLIREANDVSCEAHHAVMRSAFSLSQSSKAANSKKQPNERDLWATFLSTCMAGGIIKSAYPGIFASGTAASTLHYVHNDKPIKDKLNILVDAGGEKDCYAADITRTFPLNGKFSPESRQIYDIVFDMQKQCLDKIRPGVVWDDLHILAHKIAIKGLLDVGILHNGTVEEIFEKRTSTLFFPHGLGHQLGMDTHDTGGHPDYDDPDPMFRYLRIRGKLVENNVVTVEPGVYFCKFLIEPALKDEKHAKFINQEVLKSYWDVGGVRIEDNVVVRKDTCENLTWAVKEFGDMEKVCSGHL